jgi:hypothetical protein
MPDRDWPPIQRRIARGLRVGAFVFVAIAGAAVLRWKPSAVTEAATTTGLGVLGILAIVSGLVGAVAVALHLWHVEWVAVWFMAAAFGGYTALDWALVISGELGQLAESAALTVAVGLLLARGVDLWVFSLDASQAKRARVRAWRRTLAEMDR